MVKRWMLIGCMIFQMVLLSGCLNQRNIHDTSIILGVGLDMIPKEEVVNDERILLTVEVASYGTVGKKGEPGGESRTLVNVKGRTLVDAMHNLAKVITNQIFWGHVRCLFVGEEIVRSGINQYIDFFYRSNDISPMIFIITCRGEANKIMQGSIATGSFSSLELPSNLEIIRAFARGTTVNSYVERMMVPHSSMVLTTISFSTASKDSKGEESQDSEISENSDNQTIGFESLTVVDCQGKFCGRIGIDDDMAVMLWRGDMPKQPITMEREDGDTVNFLVDSWKVKHQWGEENGHPKLYLKCKAAVVLQQEKEATDYRKKEAYDQFEVEITNKLVSMLSQALKRSQELKQDFLLIGDTMRKQKYDEWKKLYGQWEKEFPKIPVDFDIKVSLNTDTAAFENFFKKTEGINEYREKQ